VYRPVDHVNVAGRRGGRDYPERVTAAAAEVPQPSGAGRSTFADATPAQVRAALVEQDAAEFDRQWREAMTRAMDSLDLAEVTEVLASWRRVARVTASLGADGYRDMLARTEWTLRTGERAPGAVPLDAIKARLGQ
jgi:hypothetical protein